ncbi:MAG: hypothetical protein AAFY41_13110, partial [Bacteroidota bacterium]
MPLTQYTGILGRKRAAHLLRRCCFAGTTSEIDEFAGLTAQQAFDRLTDLNIPDPILPVDNRAEGGFQPGVSYIHQVNGDWVGRSGGSRAAQARD